MRLAVAGAMVCVFGLSACTEQDILRYQDRPAQTALECEAAYQAARQRGSSTYVSHSSGASVAGAALGRGIAKGMIESAYRNCLARVANEPALSRPTVVEADTGTTYRPRAAVQPQPPGSGYCPANAGVLHGGTQYCVRR
jgi:hypothetical protein